MNVTYYGHACFSVEILNKFVLFDPFITPNPLAKKVNIKEIKADYIFVSHGHEDHVADVVKIAKPTNALVVANFEVAQWLQKKGAPQVHPLNPGGSLDFGVGKLKSVGAIHSSSMPNGTYGGVPAGFIVESTQGNFYYSGDTALTNDMKLISEATKLNFAVLCIGGNFTMDAADAVRAAEMLQCVDIMGVHYDTFPEIRINHVAAQKQFKDAERSLHLLTINETRSFPNHSEG